MLEQILHKHFPKFPGSEPEEKDGRKWTTNSAIIAQMQKANKRK